MTHSGLVGYHDTLTGLLVDIDDVTPHPENPNNGDVEQIVASIEVNGMYRPIHAQRSTGYIVSGNHTWQACKILGATQIPVVWLDIDDTTAVRILLADNKIARLALMDPAGELALLEQLADSDSLLGTGYAEYDLEALRALAEIPADSADFAQWPTLCVTIPPHVRHAYLTMTAAAIGDRERFEMLLRLAGWDGRKD